MLVEEELMVMVVVFKEQEARLVQDLEEVDLDGDQVLVHVLAVAEAVLVELLFLVLPEEVILENLS
jgi:hypothetical protein